MYQRKLPKIDDVYALARQIDHFPIRVSDVINIACIQNMDETVISFLELFDIGGKNDFSSRADYFARTTELMMLIAEEANQPAETVVSP